MQSRTPNYPYGIHFNLATDSLLFSRYDTSSSSPPVIGNFELLDGTPFLLLDGTNFLLL